MAVYVVQGKLGTGKTKFAVGKLREALLAGKRTATNLNVTMEALVPAMNRAVVIRVPDKPTAEQLDMIGHGNPDSYDEDKNGVMVLDELGSWLNARQFQDKNRAALIDWLIHARKKGWDVYLIVQHADMIDKQVRMALAEYMVKCIRADKIRIPIVGAFLGKRGRLPRMHIAKISLADVPGVTVDQEWFRGDHLHAAYDTRQIFKDDPEGAPFSYLSAWHLKGRYQPRQRKQSLFAALFSGKPAPRPTPKPKRPEIEALAALVPDAAWARARELAGAA
ncbi:UNVERIFIED_ORG: hypothetical protein ABIC43_000233 [Variovorax guangxiensis]